MTSVSWIDCVVWLNALSEMTGMEPVYLDVNKNVHRDATGSAEEVFAAENVVEAETDGYRLPTSMEWEVAARYIDGVNWTYYKNASGSSEIAANREVTQEYAVFDTDKTAAVATKKPNALGLYDMNGNVSEWCYDGEYGLDYPDDPTCYRRFGGGSWRDHYPQGLSVRPDAPAAQRPEETDNHLGFRIAQSLPAEQGST